jgi:hypothetical protein
MDNSNSRITSNSKITSNSRITSNIGKLATAGTQEKQQGCQ